MDYVRFVGLLLEHMFVFARCLFLYIHVASQPSVLITCSILPPVLSAVLSVCMCYDGC